jgi:catechol 2,3-dioxygenase-like lactoylglutathione lyase family enzyme
MPAHRLDHINLRASRAACGALRDFYCRILGLRVGARPPLQSDGLWLYAGDTPVVHLVEVAEGGESSGAATAPATAFDHVAFRCSGLEDILGRLEEFGVPNTVRVQSITGQTFVRLEDPSGLRLELVFASEGKAA